MPLIRAFVSLSLPNDAAAQVLAAIETLRTEIEGVTWTRQPHLTLLFLGRINTELLPEISSILSEAVTGLHAPSMILGRVGAFPSRRTPRVLWARVTTAGRREGASTNAPAPGANLDPLTALQRAVATALGPYAERPEERTYQPHVTLGRVKMGCEGAVAKFLVTAEALAEIHTGPCKYVDLMESKPSRSGALYISLHQFELSAGG